MDKRSMNPYHFPVLIEFKLATADFTEWTGLSSVAHRNETEFSSSVISQTADYHSKSRTIPSYSPSKSDLCRFTSNRTGVCPIHYGWLFLCTNNAPKAFCRPRAPYAETICIRSEKDLFLSMNFQTAIRSWKKQYLHNYKCNQSLQLVV